MKDLANAYRPLTFEAVVGQDMAKQLLKDRLDAGAPPPALLLSGPPGTGKTTTARIISMGLNCEKGPTSEPCGTCRSCKAILGKRSEWVYELNSGSDGGIDTLREVIAELRRPVPSTAFRVVILDEGQSLTQAAQHALLKPLEEPPARTLLVLATTHPQGLQQAIRSRCEQLVFQSLPSAEMEALVSRVADAEEIKLKPETIQEIVARSSGSPRAALKLLGQASEFEGSLEMFDRGAIENLAAEVLRRLGEGDLAKAMASGVQLVRNSIDVHGGPSSAFPALAEQIHNVLSVGQLGLGAADLGLGEETFTHIRKAAESVPLPRLSAWVDLVWSAQEKADSALMKAEALMGLTVFRMQSATGAAPAAAAPAAAETKPRRSALAESSTPEANGVLTLETLVAAAAEDQNIAGLLGKTTLVGLADGTLTLKGSTMTRKRLSPMADRVVDLLAPAIPGLQELEVVA